MRSKNPCIQSPFFLLILISFLVFSRDDVAKAFVSVFIGAPLIFRLLLIPISETLIRGQITYGVTDRRIFILTTAKLHFINLAEIESATLHLKKNKPELGSILLVHQNVKNHRAIFWGLKKTQVDRAGEQTWFDGIDNPEEIYNLVCTAKLNFEPQRQ